MRRFAKVVMIGSVILATVFSLAASAAEMVSPWKFSADLGVRYTDNRDGLKSGKEDNVDIFLTPKAAYVSSLERTVLDFYYAPSALWRSNPRDDQNDFDFYQSASIGVQHKASDRCKFFLRDIFDYTDDPKVTDGGVTIRQNASYWMNRVNGGLTHDFSPQVALNLNGAQSVKRYTDNDYADIADEDRYYAYGALNYLALAESKLLVYSAFDKTEYEGNRQNVQIVTAGVGIEEVLTPNITAKLSAGYQNADAEEAIDSSMDSPTVSGELVFSASPATRLRLNASYGLAGSDYDPYCIQKRTAVSARIERDVTANLSVSVGGLYANGDYDKDSVVEGQTGAGGDDTLSDASVNATYRVRNNLSVGMNYEYEDWNSDIRESFTRNTVSAFVRAEL